MLGFKRKSIIKLAYDVTKEFGLLGLGAIFFSSTFALRFLVLVLMGEEGENKKNRDYYEKRFQEPNFDFILETVYSYEHTE